MQARRPKRSRCIISGKELSPVYDVGLNHTWNDKDSCSSSLSIKRITVNTESWKLINLIITLKMLFINNYYNDPLLKAVTTCRMFTFLSNKAKIVTIVDKWPRTLLSCDRGTGLAATGLLTSVTFADAESTRLDPYLLTATDWNSAKTELEKVLETASIILWINKRVIQAFLSAMTRTDEKGIKQQQDTF